MNEELRLTEEVIEKARLIEKYLDGEISQGERAVLDAWKGESPENRELFDRLTTKESLARLMKEYYDGHTRKPEAQRRANEMTFGAAPAVVRPFSGWVKKLSVAAAAILIVGAGVYLWKTNSKMEKLTPQAQVKPQTKQDVAPGKYSAMLTLSDGSKIALDSAAGTFAQQGNTSLVNKEGKLVYQKGKTTTKEVLYNTLSTSRGEMYPVTLSDATKVWLNSASSIHYPVTFTGNERRVEITGEAYFEVAKDPKKPFIVALKSQEVRVLGTHFNINAYSNEPQVKTTLLEGSVQVTPATGSDATILKPGEQAQVFEKGNIKVVEHSDVEKEVAWKNRLFIFQGDDVVSVMNRLSRWYDVDVVYQGAVPDLQFYGIMNMDQPASSVLKLLQMKGGHFQIENKKIIVTP